ncbi:unnamed protein product [Trichogramma brassicae]|uniref:Transmembrane protein n=1 Tax=Trichogramma brassicae TaxID=86971 RepID=A0A6H5IXY1_9HYME|nr:unnamed protein product [Trichogramma brassicae]
MAVPAGECVLFVTCLHVNLEIRNTNDCYNEIPVLHGNETLFLAPRSRILIAHGKKITPPMFKISNTWYRMMPKLIDAPTPTIIEPQSQTDWKYAPTDALATGGVYSKKVQKKYRDLIVFPLERPAVLNQVAMTVSGKHTSRDGITIAGFLDEAMLEKIATSTWTRVYASCLNFGTLSAAVIGLIMLLRLIKLCIDATIRSYVLYEIFGFSFKLLGAMMSSVTALLIHKNNKKEKKVDAEKGEEEVTPTAPEALDTSSESSTASYVATRRAGLMVHPSATTATGPATKKATRSSTGSTELKPMEEIRQYRGVRLAHVRSECDGNCDAITCDLCRRKACHKSSNCFQQVITRSSINFEPKISILTGRSTINLVTTEWAKEATASQFGSLASMSLVVFSGVMTSSSRECSLSLSSLNLGQ